MSAIFKMTIVSTFLFAVLVSTTHQALCQNLQTNNEKSPSKESSGYKDVEMFLLNYKEKVRENIHNLSINCMKEVSKISTSQKIEWCKSNIKGKISKANRNKDSIPMWDRQLAECKDVVCKERINQMVQTMKDNESNEVKRLGNDLEACPYSADSGLIEKCKSLESRLDVLFQF